MNKSLHLINWKLTLFVLVCVPLCIKLGVWQLHRAEEKRQIQLSFDVRMAASPMEFGELPAKPDELAFKMVKLVGTVDNAHTFLLDNSIRGGKPGYEVISPIKTINDKWVLINRGWVIGNPLRTELPIVPELKGEVSVEGYIYVPSKVRMINEETAIDKWPQVVEGIDTTFIGKRLHQAVFPYTIRVLRGTGDTFKQEWTVANMPAAKHTAYAAQWFLMAVVLCGLFICSAWPRKGEKFNEE